jgi:hypothetical protein
MGDGVGDAAHSRCGRAFPAECAQEYYEPPAQKIEEQTRLAEALAGTGITD